MSTPVTDLIKELVSQGVTWDTALKAATKLEESLAENTRRGGSSEDKRRYERERKAAWRDRQTQNVPVTSRTDISLREPPKSQKEGKKDISLVPASPGQSGQPNRDDWPADYIERFWQAYPPQRRTEKAKVAKKLATIRKSGKVTWAHLMRGLERYARSGDVARGYAKGPMVWLNGGCWDDEIGDQPAARGSQPKQTSLLAQIATRGMTGEDHDERDERAGSHAGPAFDL